MEAGPGEAEAGRGQEEAEPGEAEAGRGEPVAGKGVSGRKVTSSGSYQFTREPLGGRGGGGGGGADEWEVGGGQRSGGWKERGARGSGGGEDVAEIWHSRVFIIISERSRGLLHPHSSYSLSS